ncbi:hypothetical protein HII12_000059 [Brettanomyces bruxellensis]|uniref:P-type Cu(+) transporter n=1 Tax=Dekkera bruxellensis TaxID=5007 RepID=A0A8H6BT01_DEKBR|nr:hypothetical protein HII12_000059 [Brettanomyces bruxellensis]
MTTKYKTHILVGGMTCSACTNSVTNALQSVEGVDSAEVSLMTEDAVVVHTSLVKPEVLKDAIEDVGFEATLVKTEELEDEKSHFSNEDDNSNLKTSLTIGGMMCSACVNTITKALKDVEGVKSVNVSLITEEALVEHTQEVKPENLASVVEDVGFEATVKSTASENETSAHNHDASVDKQSVTIQVFGMTCSNCSNSIEKQVSQLPGVISCTVSLSTNEAYIEFKPSLTGIRNIVDTIEDCGFDANIDNGVDKSTQLELLSKVKDIQYWKNNFFKLLLFGVPIIFLETIFPLIRSKCHMQLNIGHGLYFDVLVEFILGTYVQFWLGRRFYINSYKAFKHGSGTMDTLICTSTSIVYIYSVFIIIQAFAVRSMESPKLILDTSVMLFSFVSLGKWAESRAKGNTSTALSKLLSLTPDKCVIVANPESFKGLDKSVTSGDQNSAFSGIVQREIPVDLLQKSDIVIILPGSSIPADGVCIFGESDVDESLLTGESLPVVKKAGSKLIGGSVNVTSTMYMSVELVGQETQLQQIVNLVKDAQMRKAPVQRFADAIAAKFVPTILSLSLFTFFFWCFYTWVAHLEDIPATFKSKSGDHVMFSKILEVAISVIVVACPCALGLAAPTAVMVGTGVGATNGILIKGGEVLESTSGLDTVVFDKTGTITAGKMTLAGHKFFGALSLKEEILWSMLYAVEQNSEHPVAKAIVSGVKDVMEQNSLVDPALVSIEGLETKGGLGITAIVRVAGEDSSRQLRIGSEKLFSDTKLKGETDFENMAGAMRNEHIGTVCHISVDNEYCGYMEFKDTIRQDATATINALQSNGYSVAMVTGDNARTAQYVAAKVGIPTSNVFASSSPEQKIQYVELLQQQGHTVAFVGDGINDAPALVEADVGIAVATGTDVAMSSADIVLLSSEKDESIVVNSSMSSVFNALEISKKTFQVIRTNFVLAIIYNLVMVPLAMGFLIVPFGLHMHPMFASAAMACSSVSVVTNSLLLKRWRPVDVLSVHGTALVCDEEANVENSGIAESLDVSNFKTSKGKKEVGLFSRLRRAFGQKRRPNSEEYEMISS